MKYFGTSSNDNDIATKKNSIIEINAQYIRITDLDTGVYKLTYNGVKYIYYDGKSSTSTHTISATNTILLYVNKWSAKYWNWFYFYGNYTTHTDLIYGTVITEGRNTGNVKTIILDNVLTSYTETDPVFSASAAAGITSTNITNWNNAVTNSIGSDYIRYDNGLQMCWGVNWWPSDNAACSYPKAFKSGTAPYVIVTQCGATSVWDNNLKLNDVYSTSFKVNAGGTIAYYWFAIGTWK